METNNFWKKTILSFIVLALFGLNFNQTYAQTSSTSDNLVAVPASDRTVPFNVSDAGVDKNMNYGLDLAWLSESNIRRGIAFMGADQVDIIRASHQPTLPLVNGDLQGTQITDLNTRLNIINTWTNSSTVVCLNCDHPTVDAYYQGYPSRWADLIEATVDRVEATGRTVVSVAPFNEPDYTTAQGTQQDFYDVCGELRNRSAFNNIRLCGGNTLSCDAAASWYNFLKARLDEGNTHQLAGSFDNFAAFFQSVASNGDHVTDDELHNVMECMVGAEYGMETGIWWGTAELARGEFVKASEGKRLAYAEHRPNWTSASVYRHPGGQVQGFIGGSERQASNTSFRFVSHEKLVYYDGYGPYREFYIDYPGGTAYWTGQTNAEKVINITWGDDIQPVIDGRYKIVNRNSGKVIEVASGSTADGANIQQGTYSSQTYQQFDVNPVDSRIGGDFSYWQVKAAHSSKSLDVYDWSLEDGANISQWTSADGTNQQYYLEYAGNGYFYIRSRHSALCLNVENGSTSAGANIEQATKSSATSMQWRLLPVSASIEFTAPNAPTGLSATANAESIELNWTASTSGDVAGYDVLRGESSGGPYNTIARDITTTSIVDNTVTTGGPYYYVVKAVDNSLNKSSNSNQASATPTGNDALVALYQFEGNTQDNSENLNHGASLGSPSYASGEVGTQAIDLDGSNDFIQLPPDLANQAELTVATWIYWNGGGTWQRIFDFGNGESEYLFLTPNASSGLLRFAIKNGGSEQTLEGSSISTNTWTHVAVTLGSSAARLYVNGSQVDASTSFTIDPLDFKPISNYIGRSQYPDPLFDGRIDDFRVYNYELTSTEIGNLPGVGGGSSSGGSSSGGSSSGGSSSGGSSSGGPTSGYTYGIIARHSDKALDVFDCGSANGTNVNQWQWWGNNCQKWTATDVGSGEWRLSPLCATDKAMDINGWSTSNGGNVHIWSYGGQANQKFEIVQYDGSYYRIIGVHSGKCVEVENNSTANGANVHIWTCGSGQNQQFQFNAVKSEEVELSGTSVNIYPNPANNILNVDLGGDFMENSEIEIYNNLGKLVKTVNINSQLTSISIDDLSRGIYIIKVSNGQKVTTQKFTKK